MFKNSLISVVVLLAVVFLCFGTEPNDNTNNTFSTAEARVLALEQRLGAFEWRVNRLESPRVTKPAVPADKTKDELRVEKLRDKIQEMEDAIELAEKRIQCLPYYRQPRHPYGFKPDAKDFEIAKENRQLLSDQKRNYKDQERNYKQTLQFAEKYSNLGVDVMHMKKKLIECQGKIKKVELEEENLQLQADTLILRPRR